VTQRLSWLDRRAHFESVAGRDGTAIASSVRAGWIAKGAVVTRVSKGSTLVPAPSAMTGAGPPSTSHMRCPRSIVKLSVIISIFRSEIGAKACVDGTPSNHLGDGAGVKSRSPLAGARSAGLEAGAITQAQSFVSCGNDRSRLKVRSAGSSRIRSSPVFHVASRHINSYPVAARNGRTMNPHTWAAGWANGTIL
jgi:hypothetical protein